VLDERVRRPFAVADATSAAHCGANAVMRATDIARSTIGRGLAELRAGMRSGVADQAAATRRARRSHHRVSLAAGTGRWNKIEHRLFSLIIGNRRGRPLIVATINWTMT
jgi:hypothetical protein